MRAVAWFLAGFVIGALAELAAVVFYGDMIVRMIEWLWRL